MHVIMWDMIGYIISVLVEVWSFVLIYRGVFGISIKTHRKDIVKQSIVVILLVNVMYWIGIQIQYDNLLAREIVVCLCSVWMMQERTRIRISAYGMAYIIYSIVDNICIVLIQQIFGVQAIFSFQENDVWLRIGEKTSVFLLFVCIDYALKMRTIGVYRLINWKVYLLIAISLFNIAVFLAVVSCSSIFRNERKSVIVLDNLLIPTIFAVLLVVFLCSCIVLVLRKEELQQHIMRTLRKKNEQQEQYGRILCQKTVTLQKMRHDMHHHINYMYQAMINGEYEDVRQYLDELKTEQNVIEQEYNSYFGNRVLDTVVYTMEQRCKGSNIHISCKGKVRDDLNIDHVDLCAVFSNLLENAVEASEVCGDDREIVISASVYQDAFMIVISNPYNQSVTKGIMKTCKQNTEQHGFGIRIVREIVERYQGELGISSTDAEFCAKVIMHEKE